MTGAAGTALALGIAGCSGLTQSDDSTDDEESGEDDHHGGEDDHQDEHGGEDEHTDTEGDHDSGHGDEEHGHDSVGEPTPTAEVAVNTTDNGETHFGPHVARVESGGTVTWVLESGSHTATAYHPDNDQPQLMPDGAASWDTGMLTEEGETFEHTFETDGVYHYYCEPHEESGMVASIIVGEPDAHGQPALEEPPEDKPERVREKIMELNEMCNEALGHVH